MATKKETLQQAIDGKGCLGRAHDSEPVFVLRASDKFAPQIVEAWADLVERAETHKHLTTGSPTARPFQPSLKVKSARREAHQMRAWQAVEGSKVPD